MYQEELMVLIQQGDVAAFDEFYKKNWKPLYVMAYHSTGSIDDAKDLVQNVFISFWNNKENIVASRFHISYLFTSLKNNINNLHNKTQVRRNYTAQRFETAPVYTIEDEYSAKELALALKKLVTKLPRKMQRIFVLSRYQHLSTNEIAESLDITPRTVKNQLSTALKILRTSIIASGIPFYIYF